MNEIDLIKEVEKHSVLYDKSVSGFNKTKLREEAWKHIQEALDVSEAECKKRWRSLRDSFIKLQRTHLGRSRWPYHQAMTFLLPHIEPKDSIPQKDIKETDKEDSDMEEEARTRAIQALPVLTDLSEPAPISHKAKYLQDDDDDDSEPSPKRKRQDSSDDDTPCHCTRTDPDELFLISCAPTLKRLNPRQNALARLKIQQILLEAEFPSAMDMPVIVAPADTCYETIDPGTVTFEILK